jgi:hypothetical protein
MEDDINKNKKWKTTSKKEKKEDDLIKKYLKKIKNHLAKRNGRRPLKK